MLIIVFFYWKLSLKIVSINFNGIVRRKNKIKNIESRYIMLYNALMDELIEKLEIYRLENRVSQKQLADRLNVAFSTVNRWFNGKTIPNKIQQYHIKKLLEIE